MTKEWEAEESRLVSELRELERQMDDRKAELKHLRGLLASARRREAEAKRNAATPKGIAVQAKKAERAARIAEAPKMRAAGLTYEEMGLAWGVNAATAKAYTVKAEHIARYKEWASEAAE